MGSLTQWLDLYVSESISEKERTLASEQYKAVHSIWARTTDDVWTSAREGWMIDGNDRKGWYISSSGMRTDGSMDTNAQCEAYVRKRADEGSDLHRRALAAVAAAKIAAS